MNTEDPEYKRLINGACQKYGRTPPSEWTPYGVGVWITTADNNNIFFKYLNEETKKKYIYLLTFTLKPESIDLSEKAEEFIRTQSERKALCITSFAYVKELTKQGVPHFHVVIETTIPLKKNRFQYYEKIFGHVDISRTKGQTNQEALQYISKDSVPIVLI